MQAISTAGFDGNLVSNADDVGIIHKRIIQNLYDNPIVVCDVSGKNPNVMFELGMRLAFDKPTVIVKDDKTAYSFDTSAIEHLEYPRDLRYSQVIDFKLKLAEKIKATHKRATTDSTYTTFLKHFGEFTVAKLDKKEVTGQEYILEELGAIRNSVRRLENMSSIRSDSVTRSGSFLRDIRGSVPSRRPSSEISIPVGDWTEERVNALMQRAKENPHVFSAILNIDDSNERFVKLQVTPGFGAETLSSLLAAAM